MFTNNFSFKGFLKKRKSKKIQNSLIALTHSGDQVIRSLTNDYNYSYTKKFVKELRKFKSSFELSLMKKIKKNIDPNNIMNPGKIF